MKALIPVAGAGTQLRPLTYTQPKPLIPIAGKPIISHIIDKLIDHGITEYVFVVGYMGDKIRVYLDDKYPDIKKSYAVQHERLGLGHAVWTAREYLDDSPIIIVLGDTIVDLDLKKFLASDHSMLGVQKVNDPRQFGVVELSEDKCITKLIEKPEIPKSNLAIAGIYKIDETHMLMQALGANIEKESRTHGEFQLTDGLEVLLKKDVKMCTMKVDSWYDCGRKEILLETNARKLAHVEQRFSDLYPESIIIPPVSIGDGCAIRHSIVGPNVSIARNTTVLNSLLRDSIVGEYCLLDGVSLNRSIIGNDVSMKGMDQSLNIGDNTEIDFSGGAGTS